MFRSGYLLPARHFTPDGRQDLLNMGGGGDAEDQLLGSYSPSVYTFNPTPEVPDLLDPHISHTNLLNLEVQHLSLK